MTETQAGDRDQQVAALLLERGWLKPVEIQSARTQAGEEFFEEYLHRQGKLKDRQLAEATLVRNMSEQVAGYDVTGVIGAGAMGVVYLAKSEDGQEVALKVINKKHCDDEEFIRRFQRETKSVSGLSHPNIVSAIAAGAAGEEMFLATEYVNGPSLADILAHFGPLPERYVLQCMKQTAEGLAYAYDNCGLVHRDVKPPNILIQHGDAGKKSDLDPHIDIDIAKIIDFGLAKETDDSEHLTMTGLTVGTPHYMSPEQIRAEAEIDCRADIYSIGATMYHLLTAQTPFMAKSSGGIMLAHVNDPIPDPREIIPSIGASTVEVLKTCMAKERELRFANYRALIQALERALEGGSDMSMSLLRKPLVIKSKRFTKKEESAAVETVITDKHVADPHAQTQITQSVRREQASGAPTVTDSADMESSSVDARKKAGVPKAQAHTSNKTSAVFDAELNESSGLSIWVWLVLIASFAFLGLALYARYV